MPAAQLHNENDHPPLTADVYWIHTLLYKVLLYDHIPTCVITTKTSQKDFTTLPAKRLYH